MGPAIPHSKALIMRIKICISIITNKIDVISQHRIDVQYIFSSACFANHKAIIFGTKRSNFRNAAMADILSYLIVHASLLFIGYTILVGTLRVYGPPFLMRKCFPQRVSN